MLAKDANAGLHYVAVAWGMVRHSAEAWADSNNAAELCAACWASLLAAALPGSVPVDIFYDNNLIQGAIDSTYSFRSNEDAASTARLLATAARGQRALRLHHVHSHTGHPWNELADTLAGGKHPEIPPHTTPLLWAGLSIGQRDELDHYLCLRLHWNPSLRSFWVPAIGRLPVRNPMSHLLWPCPRPALECRNQTRTLS